MVLNLSCNATLVYLLKTKREFAQLIAQLVSQLIRFAQVSSHVDEFNTRTKGLTAKLLKQGYSYNKLRKAISKFYRCYFDLVSTYNVGLKTLLLQGLSEPEFYSDLVYIFRKILRKTIFLIISKR